MGLKKILPPICIILLIVFGSTVFPYTFARAESGDGPNPGREKKEILVKYKNEAKANSVRTALKSKLKLSKFEAKKQIQRHKMELYEVGADDNIDNIIAQLKNDPNVEYAHPNYPITLDALPNDPYFGKQWGLSNSGQTVEGYTARPGVDIHAPAAWDINQGFSDVVVGVLDTGIDIHHEDLAGNIYVNTGEIAGNGLDDDQNGFIDDVTGWNFVAGTNQVVDLGNPAQDTHGTEVTGIIAAVANNAKGISGVAPQIKILPLKFAEGNLGYTSDAIDAIDYAMAQGIKIINCSFAGGDNNFALKDAMQNSGILFVCSAGNTGGDVAETPVYPACFGLANQISVAAVDGNGVLANFSAYGAAIDVAAPGVNILTTTPESTYDYLSGTSAATPFVTGTAALVLSENPGMSVTGIKTRIKNNVKPCTNLQGKVSSGGRVDAYAALTNTPPAETDTYSGEGWSGVTGEGGQPGGDADSWYTTDQLAKVKQQIHYGESGVNPATGNFSFTVNDMSVSSPGFTIDVSRTYNSQDSTSGLLGRGWTFGFQGKAQGINSAGDMVVLTLPMGSIQRFVKNSDGSYTASDARGTFVKNADGTFTLTTKDQYRYRFNANGYLDRMEDRNGNVVTIMVNSNGRVTQVADQAGRIYTVSYNGNGLIERITDPAQRTVQYLYNSQKLLTQVIDPMGRQMNYVYDDKKYLSVIKDHEGKMVETLEYNNKTGNVARATDANGDTAVYTYDPSGKKNGISENNGDRTWTYWYDDAYYITKIQDPEGRTAATGYFLTGGKNKYGEIQSTTDRYGHTTTFDRDNHGNVTKTTNPDAGTGNFQYDGKNNLIKEEDENGRAVFYIYEENGKNLLLKIRPLDGSVRYSLTTGTGGSGKYTFTMKDSQNAVLLQGEPANGNIQYLAGSDLSKFAITTYTYYTDAEAISLGYKAKGLLKTVVDPEGGVTAYTYDANGNPATVTDPEGKVTSLHHNPIGWQDYTITDRGFRTDYTYDQNGLLIKTKLHDGESYRTVYDAMGRKKQEISPNQYTAAHDNTAPGVDTYTDNTVGARYTYYDSGQVKTVTDALNYTAAYTYDVYGNVLTESRPNGSLYLYTYDGLDRLKTVSFQDNTSATPVLLTEYSYAVLDNKNTQKTETKYLTAIDKAVTVETYDYAGRLISRQNPDGGTVKNQYHANGTLQAATDAGGSITYYRYDGLNRLTEVWVPFEISGGNILYSYTKTEYDKADRKTGVKTGKDPVALYGVPSSLVATNYAYDKNGLVKSVTNSGGQRTDYFYDDDGNVVKEEVYTGPAEKNTIEYIHNHRGNPLTRKVHVRAGDIAGNDSHNNQDLVLTTTYTYDLNGNVKTVTTPDNVTTTYDYDHLNRQTKVSRPGVDENGSAVTIATTTTYNWEGKPFSTADAKGQTTAYSYNQRGFLTGVTDAKGGVTAYYYDHAGRKTGEVSPEYYDGGKTLDQMNRVVYTYDQMDRVTAKADKYLDPTGGQWVTLTSRTYTYDKKGNLIKEQDALGVEGNYGTEYTYNLADKQVTVLDPVSGERSLPYSVQYGYDGLGRKTKETTAKGVATAYTYDDGGNLTGVTVHGEAMKTMAYDLAGNITALTDGNGHTTAFSYNAFGKTRTAVTPGDETIPPNTLLYQYDQMGNLAYVEDSVGKAETYTYDHQGRETSRTEKKSDGSQAITISVRYDVNGNKRYETDGNGVVTEYTYDQLNRVTAAKITVSGGLQSTGYTYDKNGNLLTVTDWRGNITTHSYDPLNRLTEQKDAYGKIVQKLTYTKNSVQATSVDALGNRTQYIYDKNNRLTGAVDGEGYSTGQTYDDAGNISTKTDGRGMVTTYRYDPFNRLVTVIDAQSTRTVYTYDLNGNLLTQTDGNGNTTTFQYNAANKVVEKIDPPDSSGPSGDDKTESYTYDANGNIAAKTDRNGNTVTYTYDIHGRLLRETAGSASVTYTYDNNGNQLTITDDTGTTIRTYDQLNRVLTKTVPSLGTSTYTYDITAGVPAGCTGERSTDPKGHITTKVFDRVGRLYTVTADGGTTTYAYYDNGNRQSVVYPGGAREDYTYDKNNRNKTLANKKADGTVIDSYSYTYDGAGNQISKTDQKGTTAYTYDSLNRLESVTDPAGIITRYTFDQAGNRLTELVAGGENSKVTLYAYNEQNRLLNTTTVQGGESQKVVYTYDPNGNMLSSARSVVQTADGALPSVAVSEAGQSSTGDVTFHQYDRWNRLIKTTVGDKTVDYTYNGEGLRVAKTVNGETTGYLYEYDKVVLEVDGEGNEKAHNVYGTNLLMRNDDGQTLYYMYNGHGDVTALLGTDGAIAAAYYYDAFGNILESTGPVNSPFKYAGYQHDEETGYYYLMSRYYDPVTARFITEDTYRGDPNDPLSLNLYTYCHNEPIMYVDPTGHWGGRTGEEKDEELSPGAQDKIRDLTDKYYEAKTPEEREAIHQEANRVRAEDRRSNPGGSSGGGSKGGSGASREFVAAANYLISTQGYITPGQWKSLLSPVYSKSTSNIGGSAANGIMFSYNENEWRWFLEETRTQEEMQKELLRTGLFRVTDFDLNPEVQQMISYYDDMYLYAHVAFEIGIIDEFEHKALKLACEQNADELRRTNKLDVENDSFALNVIMTLGGFTSAGLVFDVLTPTPAYAAQADLTGMEKVSKPANFGKITAALTKHDFKYTVYELYDDEGVKYVGRTRQDIEVRKKQHWYTDSNKEGLKIRPAELNGKTLERLSYSEARGLEQLVFESHGGFDNKDLLNKVRPLNIKKASEYLNDAWTFLKKLK